MKKKFFVLMVLLVFVILSSPSSFAQAGKPIIIGCPLSTGYLSGWVGVKGIKLAVEQINSNGGVTVDGEKRPFKVVVIDDRDLEPGVPVSDAVLAVQKLILQDRADFIMGGPVRSEAALAVMSMLSKYKKVSILTTGALTPKYSALVAKNYNRYKYCFRITGNARWMVGGEMAPFLENIGKKYGLNRLFVMVQDVAYARAGGRIFAKIMAKKGWDVLGKPEIYPTGTSDFSMGLLKARREKAQVINIWMDMPQASILLKQWYDMKIPALPFGFIEAAQEPGFWKATDGKVQYCINDIVNAGNVASNATPWTMKFYNAYKKRWHVAPEGYGASTSYMGPYVLKNAIERAGTLSPDAVIGALEKTDLMGVYGRIRFNPKSHQIIPSLYPEKGAVGSIFQWQAGKRVVLFPKSIAMGKIELPSWFKR